MNQEVLNKPIVMPASEEDGSAPKSTWQSYIPAFLAIFGSFALVFLRINVGGERFISVQPETLRVKSLCRTKQIPNAV